MGKTLQKPKVNLAESIRQRLKNLSIQRNRPFDEILRYYVIERFLYRLSMSQYAQKFFLKGGLMLKVWDSMDHRATMDIDLLAKTSNQLENLQKILKEVSEVDCPDDAVSFDVSRLTLNQTQTAGDYNGVSCHFSATLFTSKIPVLIDIGFNDMIIPYPEKFSYPTLLEMPNPILFGYTLETVFAEKLESIVKLATVNTRMKDFYDLWTIVKNHHIDLAGLKKAIRKVFSNRGTPLEYPAAFQSTFYDLPESQKRWKRFLEIIGKEPISFKEVIADLSTLIKEII